MTNRAQKLFGLGPRHLRWIYATFANPLLPHLSNRSGVLAVSGVIDVSFRQAGGPAPECVTSLWSEVELVEDLLWKVVVSFELNEQ